MDKYMDGELLDIMSSLERGDWEVWEKVTALDGSELHVTFCCNSEKCQRVKVEQVSGRSAVVMKEMGIFEGRKMPTEIEQILDACKTNDTLKKQVNAYNRSRFDLTFKCKGHHLFDWSIGDS